MTILALDTTTDQASVAVRKDSFTLAEELITTTDGHSQVLFQMIRTSLDKAGVSLAEIDCFASAMGPGSFTGVRICLTAVKGLAEGCGKQVLGVSNLRALATFGTAPFRNPIVDARRGNIYTAIYDSSLAIVRPETLTSIENWITDQGVERITVTPPLAAAIALIAELDGPSKWTDPAALDASYVRQADADMYWQDSRAV